MKPYACRTKGDVEFLPIHEYDANHPSDAAESYVEEWSSDGGEAQVETFVEVKDLETGIIKTYIVEAEMKWTFNSYEVK